MTRYLDMRQDNYVAWLQLISTRPHVFAIFLRNLFEPKEEPCSCREDGIMYIGGNINDCVQCTDIMCTLDTHQFLKEASTAVIGWLATIIEGMSFWDLKIENFLNFSY